MPNLDNLLVNLPILAKACSVCHHFGSTMTGMRRPGEGARRGRLWNPAAQWTKKIAAVMCNFSSKIAVQLYSYQGLGRGELSHSISQLTSGLLRRADHMNGQKVSTTHSKPWLASTPSVDKQLPSIFAEADFVFTSWCPLTVWMCELYTYKFYIYEPHRKYTNL